MFMHLYIDSDKLNKYNWWHKIRISRIKTFWSNLKWNTDHIHMLSFFYSCAPFWNVCGVCCVLFSSRGRKCVYGGGGGNRWCQTSLAYFSVYERLAQRTQHYCCNPPSREVSSASQHIGKQRFSSPLLVLTPFFFIIWFLKLSLNYS